MLGNAERARTVIEAAELYARERLATGRLQAEISNQEPEWYALTTAANHEHIAAAHLCSRGFGVYLPETISWRVVGETTLRRLMMPGYIFVRVWSLDKQARRLLGCPGVTGFLRLAGTEEPAVIPQATIEILRLEERQNSVVDWSVLTYRGPRRKPRPSHKIRKGARQSPLAVGCRS